MRGKENGVGMSNIMVVMDERTSSRAGDRFSINTGDKDRHHVKGKLKGKS